MILEVVSVTNKYEYTSRAWLSPTSTAYIHTEIEREKIIGNNAWWFGTLLLADSSNVVNFSIHIGDAKEQLATIKKLDIMLDEIEVLRNKVADMYNNNIEDDKISE